MHFDIKARTILMVRHGSHAYGLNTPTSDEDFKGVCIKPASSYFGMLHKFEQHEHMGSKSDGVDSVVYSIEKLVALATECNPNIIEILFVDPRDVLTCDAFGQRLRDNRHLFISKKARHSFSGYAFSQMKRIKTHRKWLLDPPKRAPLRADFGLPEQESVSGSEMGAFNSLLGMQSVDDSSLERPEQTEDAIRAAASARLGVDLPKDLITRFTRERGYHAAKTHYDQYVNWKKTRNPARAASEERFGLDTKHEMHLVRLMRMAKEILGRGEVIVSRPDREELLAIRNGALPYDALVTMFAELEAECAALYETSTLPHDPPRTVINDMLVEMTKQYLAVHG